MSNLTGIMEQYFLQYASYVILDRAIPDIRDGLKPVQRRILATLFDTDDGKFTKVANVVGETMKLHPHGDASIGDALVTLANKNLFIDKQGNFGNPITGDNAAAPRYIECRLNDLAKKTLFNKELTEFVPSYDGRKQEPVYLPAKLPLVLLLGVDGIAVGMATHILPHNLIELLKAQIAYLQGESFKLAPDFFTGGLVDVSEYNDGLGSVRVRARINKKDDKTIVITEIPYSTTTESLIESIEKQAQSGKIKISSIDDFTAKHVNIEISLPRGVHGDEVIQQLYAYTDCEKTLPSSITVIKDAQPVVLSIKEVISYLTEQLREQIRKELEIEKGHLLDKQHWLTLEQIFIENRVYKRIEEAKTEAEVRRQVETGMNEFAHLFIRPLRAEDVDKLLELQIRRISRYDMEKNRRDLENIVRALKDVERKLANLTGTTIQYIEDLIKTYKSAFPRKTEVAAFTKVDPRKVARATLKVSYDPDKGLFGSSVKGPLFNMTLSEYDKVIIIHKNGVYTISAPTDKAFIGTDIFQIERFEPEGGLYYTVVYKDLNKMYYAKRIRIKSFVTAKEYNLIKDQLGTIELILPGNARGTLHMKLVLQSKRQRITRLVTDLLTIPEVSPAARGARLCAKPLSKITYEPLKDGKVAAANNTPPADNTLPQADSPSPTENSQPAQESETKEELPSEESEPEEVVLPEIVPEYSQTSLFDDEEEVQNEEQDKV